MGDMFHEQITDEQIAKVLGVAGLCTNHLFIILTKRAKRAFEWSQWAMKSDYEPVIFEHDTRQVKSITSGLLPLPNVWLLASVSNQFEANERIPWLLRVPAALHGLSIEPLLGEIYLDSILVSDADPNRDDSIEARLNALTGHVAGLDNILPNRLRFIAVGGENGPNARPCDPAWIRSLRDQCVDARVAFYFKGWGKHIPDVVEHCMSEEQRQKVCAGGYIRPEAEDMPRRSFERMLDGRTWEDVPR
jgi:protein gp37